ncbi:MAG: hypothetical protein KGJ57_19545 [Sphingomonadales bacterium]|nr:hypothetical protein [Sphingomonadales bacterium]MDE2171589.1 hypothetical protein [Sphingomonadales bacterium]
MRFGHGGLVGLDDQPEPGVESWGDHERAGRCSGEGFLARLAYLLRLNLAHNYINILRKHSNDPAWITRMAMIERWWVDTLLRPAHHDPETAQRCAGMRSEDYCVAHGIMPLPLLADMREELMRQPAYHDPAVPGWSYRGLVEAAPYPSLYMESHALFASDNFFRICANPAIISLCQEVLGPRAALSWGWAWIDNPGYRDSPKWKWHRNNAEPFNALMVLVPLDEVVALEQSPFAVVPGSSRLDEMVEPRLYGDEEVATLLDRTPAAHVTLDLGDAAFTNPFALQRALPPPRRQLMIMLLVSLGPSHRSPSIRRRALADLPGDLQDVVSGNRHYFHRMVR